MIFRGGFTDQNQAPWLSPRRLSLQNDGICEAALPEKSAGCPEARLDL